MSPRKAAVAPLALPQVNLLPPEIRSRRTLRRVQARLALGLVLVLLLAGLGTVAVMFDEKSAQDELAAQEAEVDKLTAEQATYAEVPLTKSQIARAEAARAYGMSTEVLWVDFLRAIQAVAPPGVTVESLTINAPSPVVPAAVAMDPLAGASIGAITFVGRSATLPDAAAWLDGLNTIPGFSNAGFSSAEVADADGVLTYELTSTVQIDETIFAHRFDPEETN